MSDHDAVERVITMAWRAHKSPEQFPSVPDRPLQHLSVFRINYLRDPNRAESDLCPDCALPLTASPHILIHGDPVNSIAVGAQRPRTCVNVPGQGRAA